MPFTTLILPLGVMLGLAAVAASIPIVIHLLHRQRTQPILWGAMQFLIESPLQQRRRKKVDHWLLMLLRILLMIIIVALLAWPRPERQWSLLGGAGGTDIAFVIDRSLSSGRHTGNSTVFQESVGAIDQFVKSGNLKATDTVTVVLAEHQPRKLTPLPVGPGGLTKVMNELRKMKPGTSDGPIPEAVAAAREVLSRGRNGRKAVIVLSDDQRTGWKIQNLEAWNAALGQRVKGVEPDVKLYQMGFPADAQAGNATVADLSVPALVGTARPTDIRATVMNNGKKDVPAQSAKLLINGRQVAQQPVQALPAGQSVVLRFEHTFNEPNSNSVEVRVDGSDSLEQDNAAVASAFVWQQLPVLIVDGHSTNVGPDSTIGENTFRTFRGSRFLLNAMLSDAANPDAPPLIKPTIISVADNRLATLKLDDYAAVVFNDVPQLPTAVQAKLLDYARSGHGVWFILGKNSERGFIGDALAQAGLVRLEVKAEQAATDKAPPLDVRDATNAMLLPLASPDNKVLTGVDTFKWWSVKPRDPDAKVVVAAAGSNDPLVIDRPVGSNGGRVVVWTTGVDKAWNNWPAAPAFPPMVNVTLYHLAGGQTKGMENRRLESGQPIVWTGPATPPAGRIDIIRPDGSKIERRAVTRDGRQVLSYNETFLPGRYEVRFPDQTGIPQPVYYGVGIDRSELDETALNDDDRKWLSNEDHKFVESQFDSSQGLVAALGGKASTQEKVWPFLAAFVLFTLLGETYMTYRMIKRQSIPGADVIPGASPVAA